MQKASRWSEDHAINSLLYSIVRGAAGICLAPFFDLHVMGKENVPSAKSCVLLPKHQRWEDIPLLSLASPAPLHYVAKSELFTNRLSRWFMTSLGGIPLDRRRPLSSRKSILAVVGLLKGEAKVVVFPEGTYYPNSMGAGHAGLIRLIHSRIEARFIPVGIRYSRAGMRRRVDIRFGKALLWESSAGPEEFLSMAMGQIATLSGL